ncbi:YkgJ family cysteine cluster protein [Komagataeibacter sp. FNDCR2]|uniref:YkgJ family cysteine cluster protein n=1 Tax=Komagataeibacter sp. FNDCR2 TaxID=2878682 RepID=UPI001E304B94|nr:YkgJ family cysteine cluster protein [Komagataeibacter sp. FNDCR2]MCE2576568.1 YkgJ family cysteine cluster protein [Komagataeibacter sp. FNDCR2]
MQNTETSPQRRSPLDYMREKMVQADSLFRNGLSTATGESDIIDLAKKMLALCDEVGQELHRICPVQPLACHSGCDTCCRNLIQTNPVFAALGLAEARRTFDKNQFDALQDRLVSQTLFCPFLFDGKCSIYHSRPMVCRGYYSFDVELCKQGDYSEKNMGYQGDGAHAAHQYMIFLFVLEKRIESIEQELGLDPGPIFLHDAARVLLESPETLDLWQSGKRGLFAGPDTGDQ